MALPSLLGVSSVAPTAHTDNKVEAIIPAHLVVDAATDCKPSTSAGVDYSSTSLNVEKFRMVSTSGKYWMF